MRLLCAMALFCAGLSAHESLSEQIATVTVLIDRFPGVADLYFKRAELYRVNRESGMALADYERAAAADPKMLTADLGRGLTYLQEDRLAEAVQALNRFLEANPAHATALVARARARVRLGEKEGGAADFARAITAAKVALPEFYMERAEALKDAGEPHWAEALKTLDEGIQRLGPLVTLEVPAIEIELRMARFDDALRRVDAVAARNPGADLWLARRGEILLAAGRLADAREAFGRALSAMESLPPYRRSTRAAMEREQQLRAELNQAYSENR